MDGREPVTGKPLQASPRRPIRRLVKHRFKVDLGVVHFFRDAVELMPDLPEVILKLLRVQPKLVRRAEHPLAVFHLAEHSRIDLLDLMRVTTELLVVDPKVKLLLVSLLLHVTQSVTQASLRRVKVSPQLVLINLGFDRVLIPVSVGAAHLAANVALSFIPEVLRLRANLQTDSTDQFQCHICLPTPACLRILFGRSQTPSSPLDP